MLSIYYSLHQSLAPLPPTVIWEVEGHNSDDGIVGISFPPPFIFVPAI